MLELSSQAKDRLKFFLQDKNIEEWAVRVRATGPDVFSFSLDQIHLVSPLDKLVSVDGFKIVFDEKLASIMEEARIDYVETEWNRGFKLEYEKPELPKIDLPPLDASDPKVKKIQTLLTNEINPAIASHGGFTELVALKDNVVYLKMGGGCQGCASSQATLRNGIELRIKEEVPEITQVVDQTDHAAGVNPYFS
ncbi:MAG: NifU family protein [Deltaproteobacteria bacterium]|nr:NifU family protein [Deltaproteobacteria bacterium]